MFNRFMLLFEDEQKGEQNKTNKIIDKTTERVISTFKIDPNVDNSIKSTGQQILESNISNNTINFQELCEGWWLDSMSKNWRNIIALLESNSITANDLE